MNENNEYEMLCNEQPAILVRGHEVVLISTTMARIAIQCPWPLPRIGQMPTDEQKTFVMNQTQSVVNYLLAEDFIKGGGAGVGIIVETKHSKKN